MAESSILMRLDGLKIKYEELGQKLTDPDVIADVKAFVQYNKEYRELEPIIETSDRYRKALSDLANAKDILATEKDEEFREMLTDRNHNWVEAMPAIMAERPTLFVVGAGHLPCEEGVLALLKRQGYKVKPVK